MYDARCVLHTNLCHFDRRGAQRNGVEKSLESYGTIRVGSKFANSQIRK